MTRIKLLACASIFALAPVAAMAQSATATDVQRDVNQQQRTGQGLKSGQLTTGVAAKLERGESHIDSMEKNALCDGSISKEATDPDGGESRRPPNPSAEAQRQLEALTGVARATWDSDSRGHAVFSTEWRSNHAWANVGRRYGYGFIAAYRLPRISPARRACAVRAYQGLDLEPRDPGAAGGGA